MKRKWTVLLAAPTPVYAPLYLAEILQVTPVFQRIQLRYPEPDAYHSLSAGSVLPADPLVSRLLGARRRNRENDILAIVADPCRSVFCNAPDFADLKVCGGFVQRMCFWMMDHAPEHLETIEHIISHPRGMTGYMLAAQYMRDKRSVRDADELQSAIIELTQFGAEEAVYNELIARDVSMRERTSFLTSDIQLGLAGDGLTMIHGFFEDTQAHLMTALTTTQWHLAEHREDIEQLREGIALAIREIERNPFQSASTLVNHPRHASVFRRHANVLKDRENLGRTLDVLGDKRAYAADLDVSATAWAQTRRLFGDFVGAFPSWLQPDHKENAKTFIQCASPA